ncbi:hypothetical protein BDZ91DRAFT_725638 [Kalaharituber pfeilii]|nr:hypothetical protein BDZ91DRAFT_725638 [Kalaharituber pfeilii]
MGEEQAKKRKFPWTKSYSNMSQSDVEQRIGVTMLNLASTITAPKDMLVAAGYKFDEVSEAIKTVKDEVYKQIVRYLDVEVHPLDRANFMESNVNDLVLLIILPIIQEFKRKTGRKTVKLFREKQIISTDLQTGGYEDFVVVDAVSITEHKYVLIVEAKRESIGAAMGQCLLAMKDMCDSNHGGVVYGFVTSGDSWRMLSYDGVTFVVSEELQAMFETMGKDKPRWLRDYSLLVDCVYAALSNGGSDFRMM